MTIKKCEDCKCFVRSFMDPCECGHKDAPKGIYMNITGPGAIPPNWCPLKKEEDSRKVDIQF